jgi:hypothetical protein
MCAALKDFPKVTEAVPRKMLHDEHRQGKVRGQLRKKLP